MGGIDWLVLTLFFAYTLWDGLRQHSRTRNIEDLLLARRSVPWWAAGLSVIATQASAITFIGTTGLAFTEDMRFVQVYFGLPLAMVILSVTLVPYFYRQRAFTAYEALEKRFGLRVRLTTAMLFLLSRAVSLGVTIAAPAYVLALILQVPLDWTIVIIGLAATVYTMFGGMAGVIRTDVKQMVLMVGGLGLAFGWIFGKMPEAVSFSGALHLAGALGKLEAVDLSFDLSQKYNLWSGLLAGLFLMLSYFGADQSQVQRYLSARSLTDARSSLLVSAVFKIPMQFVVLLLGVMLYVFYLFGPQPLLFVPEVGEKSGERVRAEKEFAEVHAARARAAHSYLQLGDAVSKVQLQQLDAETQALRHAQMIRLSGTSKRNDTNYIFPYFILHELPTGLAGLLVAAILAAALSSIDSMLNSLAAVSVVDWYRRLHRQRRSEAHYLRATRLSTAAWGLLATVVALAFGETESIIELVNQIGSYFYGPMLGVFALLLWPRSTGTGAFWGLWAGLMAVLAAGGLTTDAAATLRWHWPVGALPPGQHPFIEYLWLNPIGLIGVLAVAWIFRGRGLKPPG